MIFMVHLLEHFFDHVSLTLWGETIYIQKRLAPCDFDSWKSKYLRFHLHYVNIHCNYIEGQAITLSSLTIKKSGLGQAYCEQRLIQPIKISDPMISSVLQSIPVRVHQRRPVLTRAL